MPPAEDADDRAMGVRDRLAAAAGLALVLLLGGTAIAAACTTVEGQLPDPVPRFRLVFEGRVVSVVRGTETPYPETLVIQVARVVHGSLEPGPHRFPVSDGCRAIQVAPGDRVLWALTQPPDLTTWNTAAWRLEPDGLRTTLLTSWREWYPFPERMSRVALARFVTAYASPPATAATTAAHSPAPAADPGTLPVLAAGAAAGVLWLVRSRPAAARSRTRGPR